MKKIFTAPLLLSFLFCINTGRAQQPLSRMQQSQNFYDIKAYYDSLFKNFEGKKQVLENHDGETEETSQDNEWMIFKRWENFYEPRVYPGGLMDYEQRVFSFYKEQEKKKNSTLRDFGTDENWSIIGPTYVPQYGGIGRINSIAFTPDDSSHIWVGTASGGLWQSTDSGQTWTTNTDLLPVLGISDIAIDPSNTTTMYMGTGDRDAGDTRSLGILKSTDGGVTWNITGLSFTTYQYAAVYRILIYPAQTNIIIAATNYGVYKTADGGLTWTQTYNAYMRDIQYKPGNDSVIYACNGNQFFISNDLGDTWTESDSGLPLSTSGRMKIALTPAAPDYVYILSTGWSNWAYNGVYRSTDGGANWTMMSDTPNVMGWDVNGADGGGQGWYTLSIAVDPHDPNTVYVGGVDIWKSSDGGVSWTCVAHWYGANGVPYVHADIHYLYATYDNTVYTTCDGGVFVTHDGGSSWQDLSGNMAISQYYRFGNSQTDSTEIIGGTQDNGTSLLSGGAWKEVYGGDGMEALIDFTDPETMYAESQGGYIGRSFDGGQSFTGIWPANGAWVTPYIIDPNNHKHLFYGSNEVWRTNNYGDSWTQNTNGITNGDYFQSLAIAPSNSDVIYAATYGQLIKTTDGGATWTSMNGYLPPMLPAITYIAVKNTDENTLWITCSGFSASQKVFVSHDGGYTWQNISDGLPNLPIDCIVYRNGSNYNELYVGTDIGVYYKEDYLSDWIAVDNGLPNVIVDELEIQYGAANLRAATYGRGIWETPLVNPVFFNEDATVESIIAPQGLICATTIDPVITIKNYGLDTLHTVQINYSIDNGANNVYNFIGTIPSLQSVDVTLPTQAVITGYHTFRASTNSPNNLIDNFPQNDKDSSTFKYVPAGIVPVSEGFEYAGEPADWETQNFDNSITWRKINVGAYGQSDSSLYEDLFDYGAAGQLDNFVSPEFDLSYFVNFAKVSFDVAYCRYSNDYHDSLFVLASADCGSTWTRVYVKGDDTLATAPPYTGWFVPDPTQWRNEIVDLTNYLGQKILISFQCRNGYGNNLYIDNINLVDEPLSASELSPENSLSAFPNPANDILYVATKSPSANATLQLISAFGQKIYEADWKGNQSKEVINVSKLPAGIYWVVMKTESSMITKKVVIQR
ncbi:MAG TPA: T9SS type A sorting domain-containing protein [Chitinophagales bacterium]|nr:T9SS type A sorting domain-containing protein [Chitinophagales bacterium]